MSSVPGIAPLLINDFSGGWNPRDAFSELAPNESPDMLNVTLDERGGVVKRLGLFNLVETPFDNALVNIFYWPTAGVTIFQEGTKLWKTTDWTSSALVHTFSTNARATFVEFLGKLIVLHPADGLASYDNTTYTAITGPVGMTGGTCIANWQNRVWVGAGVTLYGSAIADATDWTGGFKNEIREKDDAPITALGGGQGMDIQGRPGLLVYKARSLHRVFSSDETVGGDFGAYATIDTKAGAAGPLAVGQTPDGATAFINTDGIYVTDGEKVDYVSAKVANLFRDIELNFAAASGWACGVYHERFVFSVTRGDNTQTANNFTLEYHPNQGWIAPQSFGCSCYAVNRSGVRRLYGGSPTTGKVFEVFRSGADDGQPISARYHTRWFEPAGGYVIRMRRLMVEGRGNYNVFTRPDYGLTEGIGVEFNSTQLDAKWGSDVWGVALWGSSKYEDIVPFWELGVARAVSWNLSETSDTSAFGPKLLLDGTAPEVGMFALYGLHLDFVNLGPA